MTGEDAVCPDGSDCDGFEVWRTNHEDGPSWSWACNGGETLYPFSTMDAAASDALRAHIGSYARAVSVEPTGGEP